MTAVDNQLREQEEAMIRGCKQAIDRVVAVPCGELVDNALWPWEPIRNALVNAMQEATDAEE